MGKLQVLGYFSIIMPGLTSNLVSMSLRMLYLCVKIRELNCHAKTEHKLALGRLYSANALALFFQAPQPF